jgi:hypothetical protein
VALEDYSQVIVLGPTCTTSFQLKRGALQRAVPMARCSGPFDWMGITQLSQACQVMRARFMGYFDAVSSRVELGPSRDCWTIVDASGIMSCHHVRRFPGEASYSPRAWSAFRTWLDERITGLQQTLSNTTKHVLFLRGEDPAAPDREDELFSLARVIEEGSAASFRVVSVCFGEAPVTELSPRLRRVFVRPSWPSSLAVHEVDWDFDYGHGPAWRGVNEEWNRVFSEV